MSTLVEQGIYRLAILKDCVKVEIVGRGLYEHEETVACGWFDNVQQLPDWIQRKLAVLMVCDENPPTPIIPGVGRRISEDIFWVFAGNKEGDV
jgi:hypothetical protein